MVTLFEVSTAVPVPSLRRYQSDALDRVRDAFRVGHRRVVLCAATGAGKTHIASAMIRAAIERHGGPVAFLADRSALIDQTSRRLSEAGVEHGIISGRITTGAELPVQLCSVQALQSRGFPDGLRMVIVDECHDQYRALAQWLLSTDIPAIGLSATPFTRGLGRTWQTVVNVAPTDWLTTQGWLVPIRVYSGDSPDMEGAKTNAGEWTSAAVESRAIPLIGDVVEEWGRRVSAIFGGPAKTVVFASTVAHAEELAGQWARAGYRFEPITYRGRRDQRAPLIAEYEDPKSDLVGLITVDALSKGTDLPITQCLVSARPFRKSVAAWVQQLGRGLRPDRGKAFCLLLDHAGNYLRHAEAVETFWNVGCRKLDDGTKKRNAPKPPRQTTTERKCVACELVMPARIYVCPGCGLARRRPPARVTTVSGKLREYRRRGEKKPAGELAHIGDLWPHISRLAADKGKQRGWAAKHFQLITGRWPPRRRDLEPGEECAPAVSAAVQKNIKSWIAQRIRERRSA